MESNFESKIRELTESIASYVVQRYESDVSSIEFDAEMKRVERCLTEAISVLGTLKNDVGSLVNHRVQIAQTLQRMRFPNKKATQYAPEHVAEVGDLRFLDGAYNASDTTKFLIPLFRSGVVSRYPGAESYSVRNVDGMTTIYALVGYDEVARWSNSMPKWQTDIRFFEYVRRFQEHVSSCENGHWIQCEA